MLGLTLREGFGDREAEAKKDFPRKDIEVLDSLSQRGVNERCLY